MDHKAKNEINKCKTDPIHFIDKVTNIKLYPFQKEIIRQIKKEGFRPIVFKGRLR